MPSVDANLIVAFREIAGRVTTEDVMETALEMGCHYATVQRYLRGEVKKETFGKKMLEVLKGKLVNRNNNSPFQQEG